MCSLLSCVLWLPTCAAEDEVPHAQPGRGHQARVPLHALLSPGDLRVVSAAEAASTRPQGDGLGPS